jgi:cytochrome c553
VDAAGSSLPGVSPGHAHARVRWGTLRVTGCRERFRAARFFVDYNPPTTRKRERSFLRTQILFGVLVVLTAPALAAQAIPDPSTDREFSAKLSVCTECHGPSGVRKNASIPVIGGQPENYLLKQLQDFVRGERHDEVMLWMTKVVLTQQELGVAAAFFATQKWPARSAAGASTPPPPGIAVCQACHATDFLGAKQADGMAAPRLAGQSYEYLIESMRRFAAGERKNNAVMAKMMAAMSPADREAMARYLAGL